MHFGLPDEALALREGLRDLLTRTCTTATIRRAWDGDPCEDLWKELGDFGLLGLLVPEERGGLGLDELALVGALEQAGYAGVPGPLVETVAFADRLPALDGSARLAVQQPGSDLVAYGATATHVLRVEDGVLLAAPVLEPVPSVDPTRALARSTGQGLQLTSDGSRVPVDTGRAVLGTAAFLCGLARRQLDLTVEYLKGRRQFGVPVGSFQGLKHPLADAVVGLELAWPVVLHAGYALATADPQASLRVSHAKAAASDAAYRLSRVCLQAHGAIGYTVEYDLHLFMKRTWALCKDCGTAEEHRARIAEEIL
jgi:alkylation response protein AidB-like acyl-CoA dehydrogenase